MHAPIRSSTPRTQSFWCASAVMAAVVTAFAPQAAQAAVVFNPASIVDNGSFITDTANNRDWYKFSNAASTIGQSFDQATAQFSQFGWSVASLGEVQGLQSQFGWTADTLGFSQNNNFGLTNAMADFLGYTHTVYVTDIDGDHRYQFINAISSQQVFLGGQLLRSYTTSVDERLTTAAGDQIYFGDFVNGIQDGIGQAQTVPESGGVWLSRRSGSVQAVPEPASLMLVALGLAGIVLQRRGQLFPWNC